MPQLDKFALLSQVIWVFAILVILHFFLLNTILPKIASSLKLRSFWLNPVNFQKNFDNFSGVDPKKSTGGHSLINYKFFLTNYLLALKGLADFISKSQNSVTSQVDNQLFSTKLWISIFSRHYLFWKNIEMEFLYFLFNRLFRPTSIFYFFVLVFISKEFLPLNEETFTITAFSFFFYNLYNQVQSLTTSVLDSYIIEISKALEISMAAGLALIEKSSSHFQYITELVKFLIFFFEFFNFPKVSINANFWKIKEFFFAQLVTKELTDLQMSLLVA